MPLLLTVSVILWVIIRKFVCPAMIISSQQHDVQMIEKSKFEVRMVLTIRNLQKDNVGTYKCVAKNSLGDVESSIRLYGKCLCNVL